MMMIVQWRDQVIFLAEIALIAKAVCQAVEMEVTTNVHQLHGLSGQSALARITSESDSEDVSKMDSALARILLRASRAQRRS